VKSARRQAREAALQALSREHPGIEAVGAPDQPHVIPAERVRELRALSWPAALSPIVRELES